MNYKAPDDYKTPTWPVVYAYGMDWKAHISDDIRGKWNSFSEDEKMKISAAAYEISEQLASMDYED